MENAILKVNVLPFEAKELTSPETRSQCDIIEFVYAAFFRFCEKGGELLGRERLHLFVFRLWQGASVSGIVPNQFLRFSELHGGGDDLIDISHGFCTETFRLFLAFFSFHASVIQKFLV